MDVFNPLTSVYFALVIIPYVAGLLNGATHVGVI